VVIGAHYDSAEATLGADDNASGTAALIALARAMSGQSVARTLRFVAFVNEEPPYFKTPGMGSYHHAARCASRGERVVAMVSLEMLGFYVSGPGTQRFPPPLGLVYPDRGDFLAFVGNLDSRDLVRSTLAPFREHGRLPSEGLAGPSWINGVDFSDQWSYWQHGFPALMVTDTAFFRNGHYHTLSDTPDTLDLHGLTLAVQGLVGVVRDLASAP